MDFFFKKKITPFSLALFAPMPLAGSMFDRCLMTMGNDRERIFDMPDYGMYCLLEHGLLLDDENFEMFRTLSNGVLDVAGKENVKNAGIFVLFYIFYLIE